MAEDRPPLRLHPDDLALITDALGRGMPRMAGGEPVVDRPPVLTGRDVAAMQDIARAAILEVLRERNFLTESQIRAIAKEIAVSVHREMIADVEGKVRTFLTRQQIEAIAVDILRDIGLRADDEHRDETREALSGLFRGAKRRALFGDSIVEEIGKAIVQQLIGGGIIGAIIYAAIKGGAHP